MVGGQTQFQYSSTTSQTKKNSWFGKIETQEESLKVIKDVSNGFYSL